MSISRWNAETQQEELLVPSTVYKDYYSTNEIKTNKVWINDKPIYRKVFTGVCPTVSTSIVNVDINTGIGNGTIEDLISVKGAVAYTNSSGGGWTMSDWEGSTQNVSRNLLWFFDSASGNYKLRLQVAGSHFSGQKYNLVAEYTKKDSAV